MASKYQFNVTSIHFPQKTTHSQFFLTAINLIMRNELINKRTNKKSQKSNYKQKQPPEVFCKKKCSYKFRKIHRKTHAPGQLVLYKGVYYHEFNFFFKFRKLKPTKMFSCSKSRTETSEQCLTSVQS